MSARQTKIFVMIIILLSCFCEKNPVKPNNGTVNKNIVKLKDSHDKFYGFVAVWRNDLIFATPPVQKLQINSQFSVIEDSLFIIGDFWLFIEANESGSKLLLIKSNYYSVSAGALYEFDIGTGQTKLLRDRILNVSSALYWHGDDTRIVYYRYGNPIGTEAGYYLFNSVTQTDSLILEYISPLEHISPFEPYEPVNGFDLSPDNSKLLIPAVQAIGSPKIVEYDLQTRVRDTLDVSFDISFTRICLWLRYNNDGSQILYSNFPRGSYIHPTNDGSEVGIIDRTTLKKRVLDVNRLL